MSKKQLPIEQRFCIDCHIATKGYGIRCTSCHMKHLHTLDSYKTAIGKVYNKIKKSYVQKYCKDCNKKIGNQSTFCNSCAQSKRNKIYAIKSLDNPKCLDCGKQVTTHKAIRCLTCYKNRLSSLLNRCVDCNDVLSTSEATRCSNCHIIEAKRLSIITQEENRKSNDWQKCKDCGSPLSQSGNYQNNERCRPCRDIFAVGINSPHYIVDKEIKRYTGFTEELKREIRERDHNECQLCHLKNVEHLLMYGKSLPVHHIDYNRDNPSKNNLITLCIPCHMRTNSDRAYWQSYFQTNFAQQLGVLI